MVLVRRTCVRIAREETNSRLVRPLRSHWNDLPLIQFVTFVAVSLVFTGFLRIRRNPSSAKAAQELKKTSRTLCEFLPFISTERDSSFFEPASGSYDFALLR